MTVHERLLEARKAAGFASGSEAAASLGVNRFTYSQHESGVRGVPREKLALYARRFNVSIDWLVTGKAGKSKATEPTEQPLPIRMVQITGAVAAGVWREQVDDLGDTPETIPVSLPGLERATLFAMRVEGHSMNLHYPDGSLVICCPVAEMGARHGDHVIVERRENSLAERSIKELVIEGGKARLVPRSRDKRYQAAIDLPRDIHAQNGVAIVAVVVASYMTRVRKPGPALE